MIDSSALLAILLDEPENKAFSEAIENADSRLLSVATFVETSIVIESRHGAEGLRRLDRLIRRAAMDIVDIDEEQGRRARDAFSRFGKGRHSAGLNFGDCFSYALASVKAQPLLFKGDDFSRTDLVPFLVRDADPT